MSLYTCYNALGFGYWQELCHEYMPFVLPADDPRMPIDDLSSPMWRIIFLKDDCFLQPSCEVTCPSSDSDALATRTSSSSNYGKSMTGTTSNTTVTTATTITATTNTTATTATTATDNTGTIDNCDHHDPTTCPSNPIEPLFEGIDLTQHHHHSYKETHQKPPPSPRYTHSDPPFDLEHHVLGLEVLPLSSPSLSHSSSSLTLSDIEHDFHQQQQQQQQQQQKKQHSTTLVKTMKRKRKNTTVQRQSPSQHRQQKQKQKRHRQKKQKLETRHSGDGSDQLATITTTTTTNITMTLGSTTLFQQLSYAGIDWCRYCGTTEGVNWRPGPWGKRTLCNKHGCDYKGYGLASRLPRLDLSGYRHELLQDRHRPVIQEFCAICQERGGIRCINKTDDGDMLDSDDEDEEEEDTLVTCDGGCSRAFHRQCFPINNKTRHDLWFCSSSCSDNRRKKRVVVDLPRKQPLMRAL